MGRARRMPPDHLLRQWFEAGLSYQEMADRWAAHPEGDRATRMGMQNRCHNAPWFKPRQLRHMGTDLCPWTNIRPEHQDMYDIQMLRKESARRLGKQHPPEVVAALNAWLQILRAEDTVIAYKRDTQQGWWRVKRRHTDVDIVRWPPEYRRKKRLQEEPLEKVS